MGGKGISGREGTGYRGLGFKGEKEKRSLGCLDSKTDYSPLLINFLNLIRRPPGVSFLILGITTWTYPLGYRETQASGLLTTPAEPLTK